MKKSKQMGHKDVQVTLKRYTQWVPDNNVEGGYRPQNDWNSFMTQQPSLVVSPSPQMIPQRSHNRLAV